MRTPWVNSEGDPVEPSTIHILDPLVLATSFVKNILLAAAGTVAGMEHLIEAQVNTAWSREAFHEAATQEIESLVAGAYFDEEEDDDA